MTTSNSTLNGYEIIISGRTRYALGGVTEWYEDNVTMRPMGHILFSTCYASYAHQVSNVYQVAPCSKKMFGQALRYLMRHELYKGKILETRTGGLGFKGISLKEVELRRLLKDVPKDPQMIENLEDQLALYDEKRKELKKLEEEKMLKTETQ